MARIVKHELPRDKNGLILSASPIAPFLIANIDSNGYNLFQSPDGQYVIQQVTATTVRYYRGFVAADLATDWTNRAALTYGFPADVL